MNRQTALLTLSLLIATLATPASAGDTHIRLIDNTPPTGFLEMDDRTRVNEIIDTRLGNFGPAGTLDPTAQGPATLGCRWRTDDAALWVWSLTHTEYAWFDPAVIDNTYFFSDVFPDYTFTLRASDASGIRKITVRIRERDVVRNAYGIVVDDGPTEFTELWPSRVVSSFGMDQTTGSNFRDVKRLEYEPRQTRLTRTDEVMHFDMETFGSTARLEIEIEDNAGNVSHGAVYLAPKIGCPYG